MGKAALKALKVKASERPDFNGYLEMGQLSDAFSPIEKEDVLRVLGAASDLEDALAYALSGQIKFKNAGMKKTMFGFDGVLGTFSSKITMAYSLGLLGDKDHDRLEALRALRNAFAHARRGLSFETPEVKAVVHLFSCFRHTPNDAAGLRTAFGGSQLMITMRLLGSSDPE